MYEGRKFFLDFYFTRKNNKRYIYMYIRTGRSPTGGTENVEYLHPKPEIR